MRIAAWVLLGTITLTAAAAAQSRHPVSGRVLAPTMGVAGAGWLERPEREDEEAPSRALDELGVKPGMVVADIGAGSGYYAVRIAKRVGPTGRVYATDIQRGMLDIIDYRIKTEHLDNITTVLGGLDDPRLPANSLDLAIMVDVYHELQSPQAFLQKLRATLKPGGRLVLLEFRKEDPKIPILEVHKMSVREVEMELGAEGFVLTDVIEKLPWQHILVLRVK